MGDTAELEIEIDDSPAVNADIENQDPVVEAGTPPAPAEQPDSPAPEEDEKQKAIAKYAYEARVAERKAKDLEKRLQELEAKSNQTARPEVPQMPDPLSMTDEQFRQYQQERDKRIADAANWDAEQRLKKQQVQQAEQERERVQQEALHKAAETYSARAVQLGLKPEELQQAGNMVAQFGIDMDIAQMILHDEQGPLITKYLSSNLSELDELSRLPKTMAAVRVATVIKQKAASLKPRVSTAPDPVPSVGGGNVPHKDYGVEGASYE